MAPGARAYAIGTWLFLRLLGMVYFFAFWSLAPQLPGLIGSQGILPAGEYLEQVGAWADATGMGVGRYHALPTIFWIASSDTVTTGVAYGGATLALLLAIGVAPIVILPLLWIGYLSLVTIAGDFLSYQWDALLLETGLLAILVAPVAWGDDPRDACDPPRLARWLLWWLLFRLVFGSGVVKLASGDPSWWQLTALSFHYETQPLPTPLAWYAALLPLWVDRATTAVVLAVELAVPWLIATRFRAHAVATILVLQAGIALTGNYGYFNLLTVALCLTQIDDARLGGLGLAVPLPGTPGGGFWRRWAPAAVAAVTLPVSGVILAGQLGLAAPASVRLVVDPLFAVVAPFRSVNPYGLFAVMTTSRPEIEVEGSLDGREWRAYAFRHKPGDPAARPTWVAPFQPRLDWQMWFAALGEYEQEFWFQQFLGRLKTGSPAVVSLLERDPFDGTAPRFVRATLYVYRFTGRETRTATGAWWVREHVRQYAPVQ